MCKTGAEGGLLGANSDLGVTFLVAIYKYTCAYTVPGTVRTVYSAFVHCIGAGPALVAGYKVEKIRRIWVFCIYPSVAIFWLQKSVDFG